jgi:hypothetical protein
MTASQTIARHGSTSYGPVTEKRLKAVLFGDEATKAEIPRLEQALTRAPVTSSTTWLWNFEWIRVRSNAGSRSSWAGGCSMSDAWRPHSGSPSAILLPQA